MPEPRADVFGDALEDEEVGTGDEDLGLLAAWIWLEKNGGSSLWSDFGMAITGEMFGDSGRDTNCMYRCIRIGKSYHPE